MEFIEALFKFILALVALFFSMIYLALGLGCFALGLVVGIPLDIFCGLATIGGGDQPPSVTEGFFRCGTEIIEHMQNLSSLLDQ